MTSLSQQLATLLETYLPENWRLIDYTTAPDVLDRPLVMVDVKSITTGPAIGVLQASVHVYVLQPTRSSAEDNERAADESMPFVVDILSRLEAVSTVTATRGDFLEKFPAWDIDLTLYVPLVYDEDPDNTEPDQDPDEPEEA